jgi:hypothetical protein
VRHSVFRAELLRHPVSGDTVARLPRILRVVNSGMDNPAVAAAGGHPTSGILLQQKNIRPAARKSLREGATNHTAAYDDDIDLVHNDSEYAKHTNPQKAQSKSSESKAEDFSTARVGWSW